MIVLAAGTTKTEMIPMIATTAIISIREKPRRHVRIWGEYIELGLDGGFLDCNDAKRAVAVKLSFTSSGPATGDGVHLFSGLLRSGGFASRLWKPSPSPPSNDKCWKA